MTDDDNTPAPPISSALTAVVDWLRVSDRMAEAAYGRLLYEVVAIGWRANLAASASSDFDRELKRIDIQERKIKIQSMIDEVEHKRRENALTIAERALNLMYPNGNDERRYHLASAIVAQVLEIEDIPGLEAPSSTKLIESRKEDSAR